MKIEDLPEELREMVEALKHGSNTIECDVNDALESAENLDDFKARVSNAMNDLIGEAQVIKDVLSKEPVYVVIHLHRGVIFNTAVFKNADKARKYRDNQVIEQYGVLVEQQEGYDTIDLQKCQVIV